MSSKSCIQTKLFNVIEAKTSLRSINIASSLQPCYLSFLLRKLGFPVSALPLASEQSCLELGIAQSCLFPGELKMEVYGKSIVVGTANHIYLSTILGRDGPISVHKCDWKCENEHVFGNMYRCKPTGLAHICGKNCNQRILYDNHSSLCRASGLVFSLTPAEEEAVKGVRRKFDVDSSPSDGCSAFKRRRQQAQFNLSLFEKSFLAVNPICSQVGDGMDTS